MSVPAVIETLFKTLDVEFAVSPLPSDGCELESMQGAIQSVILKDGQEKFQVLYPAKSILDIDALRLIANRALGPCSEEETLAICQGLELEALPGVPRVMGLPLIIEANLLDEVELSFHCGQGNTAISLSQRQFSKLIKDAITGSFSVNTKSLEETPLDATEDIREIRAAVANFTQLRIKQRLEETLEFPPLPATAQRIIKLRVDPNADIKDLSDIVEADPALAAQVVSWAASPYYAAPGKIKSVHDAIVRVLGFDLVLNLALGLALGKTLSLPKDGPRGFSSYWQQSVYAAAAMEALVGCIAPKQRPEMGLAYLAGLLHNFGYLILAEIFPPHFSKICRYQEANPNSGHVFIEKHLIGVSREQLGAWLMRLWNMPEEVCNALRFQHISDYQAEECEYANLLFIAQRLLRQSGVGDAPLEPIPESLFERCHLDRQRAQEAIDRLFEDSDNLDGMAIGLGG